MEAAPSKSPLASTTLQALFLNLAIKLIGYKYPPVAEWLQAHDLEVMGVLTTAIAYGRSTADKPLDWKNWTIGGIGVKL